MLPALDNADGLLSVVTVNMIRRPAQDPQYANKLLLKGAVFGRLPGLQLQIVTYTGGRNRDGGTPPAGERIRCMASGVLR
jgi:hypothetical protein